MKIFFKKYSNFISINTLIIILFFSLSTSKSYGAVNDIYFCEMDQFKETEKGKMVNYRLEKFKFKRSSNIIKFGNEKNTFKGYSIDVLYSYGEHFSGGNEFVRFSYKDNYFHFSRADSSGAQLMSARCSVF